MNNQSRYLYAAMMLAVIGILFFCADNADVQRDYYQYPKVSNMDMQSYLEECRIPEVTLRKMTDEQLAQAVADFPFLINVTLSSTSYADGVKHFAEQSDAYRALLSRKNAKQALSAKINELRNQDGDSDRMMKAELLELIMQNEAALKTDMADFSEDEIADFPYMQIADVQKFYHSDQVDRVIFYTEEELKAYVPTVIEAEVMDDLTCASSIVNFDEYGSVLNAFSVRTVKVMQIYKDTTGISVGDEIQVQDSAGLCVKDGSFYMYSFNSISPLKKGDTIKLYLSDGEGSVTGKPAIYPPV